MVHPTILAADFRFGDDALVDVRLTFRTQDSTVEIRRYTGTVGSKPISFWRRDSKGNVKVIDVSVPDDQWQQSNPLPASIMFSCMESFKGCNTALQLWPTAPPATESLPIP